ncbi:DUF2087 domain-containing protein [Acidiferrimicrobium sp. IK]|uniref:DUF2087 domain-containing protein n=1 Tax=Acidiferrimicrobium sp. IK TaxID=2871700 RepID=UPI0021CB933B|nr:DUF2087 domain-containing protein [Acidiferrimicrobium sp. IK]MCU4185068.1 DUF2087 domain-containing protein [Acidiferrimicrobium sp. IK]
MSDRPPPPAGAPSGPVHPGRVLAAIASETRLRVLAAVVLDGPLGAETVAARAAVSPAETRRALARLAEAGVVTLDGELGWRVALDSLGASARLGSALQVVPDPGQEATSPQQAAVLRAYLHNGRLRSVPAQRQKRLAVLDWLSQKFEPGKVYSEAEVTRTLERYHPDHAALRRFLVDEGFMARREGFYWRAGGTSETE